MPPRMASLQIAVVPRFPTAPLIEQEKLYDLMLRQGGIPWRGTGFPRGNLTTQHESVLRLSPHDVHFSDLSVWGQAFYGFRIEDTNGRGIHLYETLGLLLASLRHADLIIRSTGHQGTLDLTVRLCDIRAKEFAHVFRGFVDRKQFSPLDNMIELGLRCDTEDLRNDSDGVALRAMRMFFFAGDWPEIATSDESLSALLTKAYEYNSWRYPTA